MLLIHALDDDDNGALSIAELADFVERGTATFHSGPVAEHTNWGDHGHAGTHAAGESSDGPGRSPASTPATIPSSLYSPSFIPFLAFPGRARRAL